MRIIGIDLHGTITPHDFYNPDMKLPWLLFCFLFLFTCLLSRPKKEIVKKLQILKNEGCKIIIVSARPIQLTWLTKFWLVWRHVPYDKLFCVGFGKGTKERKLRIINEEKIETFIDDSVSCIEFLEKHSVNAMKDLISV